MNDVCFVVCTLFACLHPGLCLVETKCAAQGNTVQNFVPSVPLELEHCPVFWKSVDLVFVQILPRGTLCSCAQMTHYSLQKKTYPSGDVLVYQIQ